MCLGVPGRVIEIHDAAQALALVDLGGVRRLVSLACVLEDEPVEACVGAWVLVHVGFALSRVDEAEAQATLALLRELEQP